MLVKERRKQHALAPKQMQGGGGGSAFEGKDEHHRHWTQAEIKINLF
jgi:hypothetical protein